MSQFFTITNTSSFVTQTSGTFTPQLLFGGSSTDMAGTFLGSYVKTGLQVDLMIQITLTAKGSSTGDASISGLPFTTATSTFPKMLPVYLQNSTASGATYTSFAAQAGSNTTTLANIYEFSQSASPSLALDDTSFTDTSVIVLTGTYMSAS